MRTIFALSPLLEFSLAWLILLGSTAGFLWFVIHYQHELAALGRALAAFCRGVGVFFKAHLGANWRTTLTAVGTALSALLTGLAALPYDLGPIADIIPPKAKATVATVGGIATVLLHILNGLVQKDRNVTGGTVQQNTAGQAVPTRRIVVEDTTTGEAAAAQAATPPSTPSDG